MPTLGGGIKSQGRPLEARLFLCPFSRRRPLWWRCHTFPRGLATLFVLAAPVTGGLSQCLDEEPCESFSHVSRHSLDVVSVCHSADFLLGESVDVFGDGAWGDFPLDLEGSPSLLVELGASPKAWED